MSDMVTEMSGMESGSEPTNRARAERRDVRGISDEAWEAARKAARRADLALGRWLEEVIMWAIRQEREPRTMDGLFAGAELIVPEVPPEVPSEGEWHPPTLAELETVLALAQQIATERGKPVPRRLLRRANQLLQDRIGA